MQIFRKLEDIPPDFGPCVITIGNFDGLHAGHRQIMRRVAQIARERVLKPSVLTFDPHPTKVVAPARAPKLITTVELRCPLMREDGIEQVLILPFDLSIASWTPEQFVKNLLVDRLGVRVVLVGADFRFGHHQAGDTRLLAALGERFGFRTELIEPVNVRGERVSSSLIRRMVQEGRVARACRLLTRPFAISGNVVAGHGIGSKQTVPTLNLAPDSELLPRNGVYITRTAELDGSRAWQSITNVGYRPTFDGDALTIETFLLEPLTGESPKQIRVDFLWRVRDERKFESPEALKSQILKDVGRARVYFRRRAMPSRAIHTIQSGRK
ncbi:MAG: bifunctional riboflavin kinase/FAD synthetase [Acidobacteriota bacterium]|nr:bifunctional riboflavin kinase/FAD synthetase [Acidobacteriota bacterium]